MNSFRSLIVRALFSHLYCCMHRTNGTEIINTLNMIARLRAKQGLEEMSHRQMIAYTIELNRPK